MNLNNQIIILILLIFCFSLIKCDPTTCQQKYMEAITGQNPEGVEMIFLATGKDMPTDLGDYDLCTMLKTAHHCVVSFGLNVSGTVTPLKWGFCIPKECTQDDVSVAVSLYISIFYSFATVSDQPMDVFCADNFKKKYSAGVIITLIIVIISSCLVISGTISKFIPNLKPIKESDEYEIKRSKWKIMLIDCLNNLSLQTNWQKLIQKFPDTSLKYLNGIRVISMFWIIFGHTVIIQLSFGYNNEVFLFDEKGPLSKWPFQFILGAEFAVDTFFFLSGFLMAHLAFERRKSFNIGLFYFHRFWRLLPSLGFVLLVFTFLAIFFGDGPYFGELKPIIDDTCGKYWYSSLLFFNNFYPKHFGDECMGWVWYLANDTQFYIISPIFLYSFFYFPLIGLSLVAVFIIVSIALNFWIVHHWNINFIMFGPTQEDYNDKIYTKPYTRIPPFLVGCALAMFLYLLKSRKNNEINQKENDENQLLIEKDEEEKQLRIRNSKFKRLFTKYKQHIISTSIFLASLTLLIAMVMIPYDNYKHLGTKWTVNTSAWYIGFSKFGWGIGIAGIVFIYYYYPTLKSIVKDFLSLDIWTPLAKLTYNAYLVHPIIMSNVDYSSRILYNYSAMPIFFNTTTNVILSYFFSLIVYFLIERPFMHLERFIMS
ncbi:o-acyltransferase [Anaeramoeba ignava]|uniref:O-acyltransferase n=1 Tax=Anaeramoeba ignava TaxID=1746090 RepID=A0A9Q0LDC0_ANAIG|nr:o-acyltransferase [Anaeramoeba ignava]